MRLLVWGKKSRKRERMCMYGGFHSQKWKCNRLILYFLNGCLNAMEEGSCGMKREKRKEQVNTLKTGLNSVEAMQFGHVLSRLLSCWVVGLLTQLTVKKITQADSFHFSIISVYSFSHFFRRYCCLCMSLFLDENSTGAGNARLRARSST